MTCHHLSAFLLAASMLTVASAARAEPGDPLPAARRPRAPELLVPTLPCQKLASTPLTFASKKSDDSLHVRVKCSMEKGQDQLWRAKACTYDGRWNGLYMPRLHKSHPYRDAVENYMSHACFTDGQLTPYISDEQTDQPDAVSSEDAWSSRLITPWRDTQLAHGISPAQDDTIGNVFLHGRTVRVTLSFTHVPPVTAEENDQDRAAHSPARFQPATSLINLDSVSSP
ncbi:hypothetical protein NQF87_04125 [Bombella sp. TMW 2.2559]|uniref:Uncharacterized protein n=1 Tax=Bombella dulcis TaxID=2967339 RepID=A0ABT3WAP0_9PROT|nr:hypothetical protein [Bombella dulcis]MCX5616162.1 hypothetical protein [Bombella dulcis]